MREPEWTEEAWERFRELLAYIERQPRGDPEMRADEVFAAVDALPAEWERYQVRHRAGVIGLRRLLTEHGSVVVFSHEEDARDLRGVIVVRWVAHAHAEQQVPRLDSIRPWEATPRVRPRR